MNGINDWTVDKVIAERRDRVQPATLPDISIPVTRKKKSKGLHTPNLKILHSKYRHKDRWLFMSHEMLISEAFMTLKHIPKVVLLLFLQKRRKPEDGTLVKNRRRKERGFPKYIETDIIFTASEALLYGIHRRTFQKAIDELIAHGFIAISTPGGSLNGKKIPNSYDLIDAWKYYGTKDFRPFKRSSVNYGDRFEAANAKKGLCKGKEKQEASVVQDVRKPGTDVPHDAQKQDIGNNGRRRGRPKKVETESQDAPGRMLKRKS